MSVSLCPVVRGDFVEIYTDSNAFLGSYFISQNNGGSPNVYVSGTNVVVQYPDGIREIYFFDANGDFLRMETY